jgi:hypothetical protein
MGVTFCDIRIDDACGESDAVTGATPRDVLLTAPESEQV